MIETFNEPNSQISETGKDLQPLWVSKKKEEYWASGTNIQMWYLTEDYNSKFNWSNKHDTYQQMYYSDSTVFKTLLSCELPIRSADWKVEAYKDKDWIINEMDDEISEFVRKALFDKIDFDQFLFEVLSYIRHWFSVFEKVYETDWEFIWIKKLGFRKQKSIYQRQQENWEPGVQQYVYDSPKDWPNKWKTYFSIPANKLMIFSFRKEWDNYEWLSILRPVAKNRFIKDQLEKFLYVKKEKDKMLEIVTNVRANEKAWIVMPWSKNDWRLFEFADLKSWQDSWLAEAIKRHDSAISDIMLWLFIKLGWEWKTGSYWMAESQISFFILWLEAIAKHICSVINKYLIPELVDMNFDTENYPKISYWEIGSVDINKVVTSASSLVSAWLLTPDETTEQYLRKLIDLPEKVEQEEEWEDEEKEIEKKVDNEKSEKEVEKELDKLNKQEIEKWKWKFYDQEYFTEISKLINNDFIKKLQAE
jgi:hypothetical protein